MGSILDIMPGDVLVMVAQMLVQNGASDSSPKKIFKEDICWIALSKYSMHRTQSVHVKKRHLLTYMKIQTIIRGGKK